jgi:ABC-type uncharacterized transport system permease subunit
MIDFITGFIIGVATYTWAVWDLKSRIREGKVKNYFYRDM